MFLSTKLSDKWKRLVLISLIELIECSLIIGTCGEGHESQKAHGFLDVVNEVNIEDESPKPHHTDLTNN